MQLRIHFKVNKIDLQIIKIHVLDGQLTGVFVNDFPFYCTQNGLPLISVKTMDSSTLKYLVQAPIQNHYTHYM